MSKIILERVFMHFKTIFHLLKWLSLHPLVCGEGPEVIVTTPVQIFIYSCLYEVLIIFLIY